MAEKSILNNELKSAIALLNNCIGLPDLGEEVRPKVSEILQEPSIANMVMKLFEIDCRGTHIPFLLTSPQFFKIIAHRASDKEEMKEFVAALEPYVENAAPEIVENIVYYTYAVIHDKDVSKTFLRSASKCALGEISNVITEYYKEKTDSDCPLQLLELMIRLEGQVQDIQLADLIRHSQEWDDRVRDLTRSS
jgi:hypothetical protein